MNELKEHDANVIDKHEIEEDAILCIQKTDRLKDEIVKHNDAVSKQLEYVQKFFEDFDAIKEWAPILEEKMVQIDSMCTEVDDMKLKVKELDVSIVSLLD